MTTVLVVEDEAIIRMAAVEMLEDAGFAVLQAGDGDIALKILQSRTDIDVVFTDIQMPGSLCGLQLVNAVRKRWPPIHLIVASGLQPPTEAEFPTTGRFLRKPYSPQQVLMALQELLGPNPAPYRCYNDAIQNCGKVA